MAAIRETGRNAITRSRITRGPVCYWRLNELRVRHDHGDVVVGQNDSAARANLLHLPGDSGHLYSIADRDRPFRQNDEAANEIAGNVLQSEANPDADCTGENGQCAEMDTRVIQHNEKANNQDNIADDLRD